MRAGGSGTSSAATSSPRLGRPCMGAQPNPGCSIDWIDQSVNGHAGRRSVRAAAVQLSSTEDRQRNLAANDDYARAAAPVESHPTVEWARRLAAELHIDLVPGSIVERREGRDKHNNTSVHIGPDGELKAVYRKIHLFDVELADSTRIGLTICYDLRFPELYRIQAIRGARIVTVPANFTRVTGEAHWDVLLRARAIENQAFVIAAAQF